MNKQCAAELEKAREELAGLTSQRESAEDFQAHIAKLRKVLREASAHAADGMVTKEFVDTYVDKIFATPQEDGSMLLQIKIFTGETTDRYLTSLRGRAGHTFKKMIQAYENGMQ